MADLTNQIQAAAGGETADVDPNFNQTVLLLHGDGTNGVQNNTFLDGSTNNFTITRNGNTTQGTFSPFSSPSGYWSTYFSTSYVFFNNATNLQPGTSAFTLECWVYNDASATSTFGIIARATSAFPYNGYYLETSNGKVRFITNDATDGMHNLGDTAATTLPKNQWVHIAVVREGTGSNEAKMYMDGVLVATDTMPNNLNQSMQLRIGTTPPGSSQLVGYISNVRFVKGTAVYTSAFTPSTTPLTAITNTQLLTLQDSRRIDNSANNYGASLSGTVIQRTFSPFPPTAAYDPAVNGGSGYFDGTGDYLSIADAAGLRFGTGNFTIQAWIYRSVAGAVHSIAAKGGASTGWVFQVHSDNKLRFTQTTTNINSTGTIQAGEWTHVAVVREGTGTNQTKLYINGVNDGQATVTTDFNQTEQLNIGADRGNANPMNGYIAGFKYVVGTAETITVPTALPTGGTALLNFTNAGIFDNTGKNNLETVADAQVDTGTKKYGTGSLEFDGTGDWLLMANTFDQQLGTGNFTIEFWVYLNATGVAMGFIGKGTSTTGLLVSLVSTNTVRFTNNTSTITSTGTLSASTWNHIAVVREGTGSNLTKIYINGTNDGTGTVSTNFNQTSVMYVGANRTGGDPLNGLIDELRITKGVARYTANFTPPTKKFPDF